MVETLLEGVIVTEESISWWEKGEGPGRVKEVGMHWNLSLFLQYIIRAMRIGLFCVKIVTGTLKVLNKWYMNVWTNKYIYNISY